MSGGRVTANSVSLGSTASGRGPAVVFGGTFNAGNGLIVGANGSGTMTLTGGVTTVRAGSGTLILAQTSSSQGTLNPGAGSSVGTLNASQVFGEGGTAAVNLNLTARFDPDSTAANDGILRTDVLHLNGVPVVDPDTGETDIFVLELSFTCAAPDSYLAWLDTEANAWVNAVDGYFGNNLDFIDAPFAGSFAAFQSIYGSDLSDYVGAWGISQSGGVTSTWAVPNHNSDFAVVPEPRVTLVVGLGVAVMAAARRRPAERRWSLRMG